MVLFVFGFLAVLSSGSSAEWDDLTTDSSSYKDQTTLNSCAPVPAKKRWSFRNETLIIKIQRDINLTTINSNELNKAGIIAAVGQGAAIEITISGRKLSVSCYGSIKAKHIDVSDFVEDEDNFLELNWKAAGGIYQDGFDIQWRGMTKGATFLARCESSTLLLEIYVNVTGNLFDCVEEVEQEEIGQ
eukprot:sb/3471329/